MLGAPEVPAEALGADGDPRFPAKVSVMLYFFQKTWHNELALFLVRRLGTTGEGAGDWAEGGVSGCTSMTSALVTGTAALGAAVSPFMVGEGADSANGGVGAFQGS